MDLSSSVVGLRNISNSRDVPSKGTYLLPPLVHAVHLVRVSPRTLFACSAKVLHAIQLVLAPLPYVTLRHLWPSHLDWLIRPILDGGNETGREQLNYLLIPLSLECLSQANTGGVGIWPSNAVLFERIDQPLLRFIRKVAFCYKHALCFKELAHCVLRDISSDLDSKTNYVRPHACLRRHGEPSSSRVELQSSHDYRGNEYPGHIRWKGRRTPVSASFPFELGWSG